MKSKIQTMELSDGELIKCLMQAVCILDAKLNASGSTGRGAFLSK